MTRNTLPIYMLAVLLLVYAAIGAFGQSGPPSNLQRPGQPKKGDDQPPSMWRFLGLSDEQLKHIQEMNREHRAQEREVRQRYQTAMRELDAAIYATDLDEDLVKAKLEEFRLAQGELSRLRFRNELLVRKVLTPEQLLKFRDMRRRFNEQRDEMEKSMKNKMPATTRDQKPNRYQFD